MTTKSELIAAIKTENPTLRTGSDEYGYVELNAKEYEATVEEWATSRLEQAAELAEAEALATAKAEAIAKLTALGIDPKALGL